MHYLLPLSLLLFFVGCVDTPADADSLLEIEWQLVALQRQAVDNQKITFKLKSQEQELGGFTGCNHFSGFYTKNKQQLHFSELTSTTKACLASIDEDRFLHLFVQTAAYQVQNDTLELHSKQGDVLGTFIKTQPQEMTNTSLVEVQWNLYSWTDETTQTTIRMEQEASLTLQSNSEQLDAYTGCNNVFGSYTQTPSNGLRFSELFYTEKACPGVMELEQVFLSILNRTDNFRIEGDELTLLAGKNSLATFKATKK